VTTHQGVAAFSVVRARVYCPLMPRLPEHVLQAGVDPEDPRGRFNPRPAVGLSTGEYGDGDAWMTAETLVREVVGDWLLDEDFGLGPGRAIDGSGGRGGEAWIPVVTWETPAVIGKVVGIEHGVAMGKIVERLAGWRVHREADGEPAGYELSRGAAGLVATGYVSHHHQDSGPLGVEAVEEPASVAGHEATEISYVGVEPWIVLLRNDDSEVRYVVVVSPQGYVAGDVKAPFLPFEGMFLRSFD
jgi:hypothetical protein